MNKKRSDSDKSFNWMVLSGVLGGAIIIIGLVIAFFFFTNIVTQRDAKEVHDGAIHLHQVMENVTRHGEEKLESTESFRQKAIIARLKAGDTNGIKVVFLTFDDGPTEHTGEVLDLLAAHGIKATFFVNQSEGDTAVAGYKRIVAEGHTLANHTANHNYKLYKNPTAFYADVQQLDDYIKQVTGVAETSHIFRFPGGSLNANKTCIKGILDRGYNYVDWNVSTGDAAATQPSVDAITAAVMGGVAQHDVSVVLCHGEKKENTRAALPGIIDTLKGQGYTFLPMTADLQYPRQLEL